MTEYCGETTTKRRARSNTPFSFILHPPPTTHKRIFLNHSRAHSFPLSPSSRPPFTRPRWYPTHITKPWDSGLVGGFHQYKTRPHTFPRDFSSTTTTIKLSKCGGGGGGGCFGRKRGWMEMVSGWEKRERWVEPTICGNNKVSRVVFSRGFLLPSTTTITVPITAQYSVRLREWKSRQIVALWDAR